MKASWPRRRLVLSRRREQFPQAFVADVGHPAGRPGTDQGVAFPRFVEQADFPDELARLQIGQNDLVAGIGFVLEQDGGAALDQIVQTIGRLAAPDDEMPGRHRARPAAGQEALQGVGVGFNGRLPDEGRQCSGQGVHGAAKRGMLSRIIVRDQERFSRSWKKRRFSTAWQGRPVFLRPGR